MTRSCPKLVILALVVLLGVLAFPIASKAIPTQFGDTGLISQPSANTLNEGNICIGLWANCAGSAVAPDGSTSDAVIVPAVITMGLGTFMETFGSYPNLLFNGDEGLSGRGMASAGFKFRVYGDRSDPFHLGWDILARRTISDDPEADGLTDYVSRIMASLKLNNFGFHLNGGYAKNDSSASFVYDDQFLLGGGIEYFITGRLRVMAEYSFETEKIAGVDGLSEASAGFQFFMTPHLTMSLNAGVGLSESSPDWRVIFGLTTCQGVGTYNRPVPRLIDPEEELEKEPEAPPKPVKIRILTPLIAKAAVADSPVSHLEVPVTAAELQLIDPSDRMETPKIASLGSPTGAITPFSQAGETVDEEPLLHETFAAKVIRKFRFPQFAFAPNQWDLSPEGEDAFNQVAEELRQDDRYFVISVEGHTDDIGPENYNMNLSFRRAVTAATHLVIKNGIDPARLFVKAFGENQPIATNDTAEGRAQNRRVELLVLIPDRDKDSLSKARSIRSWRRPAKQAAKESKEPKGPETAAESREEAPSVSRLKQPVPVDALSIEQAISEKTGAVDISPSGSFSQTENIETGGSN
ncbi:MAG: hypothetical protein C0614_13925 [Desulfuromonas sp.]|nr:MAG: hypothetical protein C0614_13925 [Desulfuromonas sp.]